MELRIPLMQMSMRTTNSNETNIEIFGKKNHVSDQILEHFLRIHKMWYITNKSYVRNGNTFMQSFYMNNIHKFARYGVNWEGSKYYRR